MSLIITSNQIEDGLDEDGVAQEPYMYRNYMKQPLIIPKDSEVAVQSVKFSRDETITIRPGQKWFQMYNINLEDLNDGRTSNDTTGYPIECNLETTDNVEQQVSLETFLTKITQAIRRGYPHPDILGEVVDSDITPICKSYYSGSNDAFAGLSLRQSSKLSAEDDDYTPTAIKKAYPDADNDKALTWNSGTREVIAPDHVFDHPPNNEIDPIGYFDERPISLYQGNMRVDIGGVCADTTDFEVKTQCAFGLTRSFDKTQINFGAFEPEYFDRDAFISNGEVGGVRNAGQNQFFDFAIRMEPVGINDEETDDNYLKVVASCMINEGGDEEKICMKEIEYWGWSKIGADTPKFDERYNMTENDETINQFLIRTEGEQVLFYYHTGALSTSDNPLDDAGWELFCGFSMASFTATNNKNIPPPINQCQWNMYPQFWISSHKVQPTGGGAPVVGKLEFSAFSGRDLTNIGGSYYNEDTDWWARMNEENTLEKCQEVETRPKFNDPWRQDGTFYTQLGCGSKGVVNNYVWAYILLPDTEYYIPTDGANADKLLGFDNYTILQPAKLGATYDGGYGWKYDSVVVPPLINDGTLFIRLDNFTQKTLNSAVSRPSKILYCCPRFDSSGRSAGDGLYFEPHERVYVKLGNPTELNINEFDISICDIGERLAKHLKGQTIINLHIRENQTGMRQEDYLKKEKDEGVMIF